MQRSSHSPIIIAIDGFAACGKSTLAKSLAKAIGYAYIDTGAMYRAVTLFFLDNNVNLQNPDAVAKALESIKITFQNVNHSNQTFLNGKNVEAEIRTMRVSEKVSEVAAISAVRRAMVRQQQEMGKTKGVILDGRDIGTVVFPDARLKLFLTASEKVRTQRRLAELTAKGQTDSQQSVRANLLHRDHIDSNRKDSPLKQAEDAVVIDNTNLDRAEQLAMVLALFEVRTKKK